MATAMLHPFTQWRGQIASKTKCKRVASSKATKYWRFSRLSDRSTLSPPSWKDISPFSNKRTASKDAPTPAACCSVCTWRSNSETRGARADVLLDGPGRLSTVDPHRDRQRDRPSLTQALHPTAHLSLVGPQAAEKPSEVGKNKLNDSFKRHPWITVWERKPERSDASNAP